MHDSAPAQLNGQHGSISLLQKIVILLLVGIALAGVSTYVFITRVPNAENPQMRQGQSSVKEGASVSGELACSESAPGKMSYSVTLDVETIAQDQPVYTSHVEFELQLQAQSEQDSAVRWLGRAKSIIVNEGAKQTPVEDVLFSAESREIATQSGQQLIQFTQFNNLGLAKHHPMHMLSQVIKNLSIGEVSQLYQFSFDPLERKYSYSHKGQFVERQDSAHAKQVDKSQSGDASQANAWVATISADCTPQSVFASETQQLAGKDVGMQLRYGMSIQRLSGQFDIAKSSVVANANQHLQWEAKAVSQTALTQAVETKEQMWDVINQFSSRKNMGQLVKAAQFMIANVDENELRDFLLQQDLDDTVKRDAIFALGVSNDPKAEAYMIDVLGSIGSVEDSLLQDNQVQLQQVRLMASMASNGLATEESFTSLQAYSNADEVSTNVRSNALINMGTLAGKLDAKGEFSSQLQRDFTEQLEHELSADAGPNTSAAIFAVGNAHLREYSTQLTGKLTSNDTRVRYAAGSVLAQDPSMLTSVLPHLAAENSNLVVGGIVSGIKQQSLNSEQISYLQSLAAQTDDEEKRRLIESIYSGS